MERISDLPREPGDGIGVEYDDELDRLSTRRDRLRAERAEAHQAPARVRLRLGAVLVVLSGILTWFAVAWLSAPSGADASAEELPDPPEAQHPSEHEADRVSANEEAQDDVVVHVSGAVKKPQVVELPPGARVMDAVDSAGGMTEEAAAAGVNLAAVAEDGSHVWIPTEAELEEGGAPPAAAAPAVTGDSGGPINLNTADAATLEELTGIGPALAERIISHRESTGAFESLEDIGRVSGIGPAILENIADDVTW
ncbi:helix-hairpin-helix domain-containing protein [Nesterenkonia sp. NBAIMH1]|uniref:helix-hairpin-helix domain-containing protein n=1 Tax=Nesterenkonia sp. NBAIMH1 TaxID=2600320 RepID=UPI0011B7CD61|nr:helix-hairpin-helix domain-containing protein [Nesterenkonia sp. NBAIMH1]